MTNIIAKIASDYLSQILIEHGVLEHIEWQINESRFRFWLACVLMLLLLSYTYDPEVLTF